MAHAFAEIAFTDTVKALQKSDGSRRGYAKMEEGLRTNHELSDREADFIAARDSFYMASVSETGWPYVQHRGGPVGFVRVLDSSSIGFTDFRGNRQFVSLGNLTNDNRVSLFFMDYVNKTRLKLLGRVRFLDLEDTETLGQLSVPGYRAKVERGFVIDVEGFDWNCPQHINPRYTAEQVNAVVQPLQGRIAELETTLAEGLLKS